MMSNGATIKVSFHYISLEFFVFFQESFKGLNLVSNTLDFIEFVAPNNNFHSSVALSQY